MKKQLFLLLSAAFMLFGSGALQAAASSSRAKAAKSPELQEFHKNPGRFDAFLYTERGQSDFVARLTKGRAFLEQFERSGLKEQKDILKRVVGDNLCNAAKFLFCNSSVKNILNEQCALLCSVENGHEEMTELCLKAGANPNVRDRLGNTALHNALFKKKPIRIITALLNAKSDYSLCASSGEMPLHLAAYTGYSEAVKALLAAGADQHIYNALCVLPLHFAVQQGYAAVVKELLPTQRDVDALAPGMGNRSALSIAIIKGHVEICRMLLAHGANPNLLTDGRSPLYLAAGSGHQEIVEMLLVHKADQNIMTQQNESPLSAASNKGHVGIIRLLLACDGNPNTLGVGSPLYAAAQNGHIDAVQLLLENGADPNLALSDGFSPLHMAAYKGHTKIAEMLVAAGALMGKSEYFGSPLVIALMHGYDEIADVLLGRAKGCIHINDISYHTYPPIWVACANGNVNMINKLIAYGADPNWLHRSTDGGRYAIHRACELKNVDVLRFLMALKVDINVRNRYKETPLYIAASNGNLAAVTLLCEAGADKEAQNILNLTALDIAQVNGHKEVARFLQCGPVAHVVKSSASDKVQASSSVDDAVREERIVVTDSVVEQKPHQAQSQRAQSSRSNTRKKSRGQPVPLTQVFKRAMGAHEAADNEEVFALRQAAEGMTVIVYKGAPCRLPRMHIANVSDKQDKFHLFSAEVDTYLNRGIYVDDKNQGKYSALLKEYGIREIRGFCVILPGKIESGHYDVRYIQFDKEDEPGYGYVGAFIYLFERDGRCYHRCFHQNYESKRRHNILD